MREILFRGKRIKDGKWVYGYYFNVTIVGTNHYIKVPEGNDLLVDPVTIGQCTELTDKNGTRIFEGDIVRNGWTKSAETLTISWDDKRACFVAKSDFSYREAYVIAYECQVIGDIHDNPELIKAEKQ